MTNEATVTVEVAGEAPVVIEGTTMAEWKGKIVNHAISARAQAIAATIEPLSKENEKGITFSKDTYYRAAGEHGFSKETLQDVEKFQNDYVSAIHAVSADRCLSRFNTDKSSEEYTVRGHIGESSTYKDNFRRFHSRQVRNLHTGETSVRETHAYHNPSIETEYKGFNDSRQAVHNLAKDLFGK